MFGIARPDFFFQAERAYDMFYTPFISVLNSRVCLPSFETRTEHFQFDLVFDQNKQSN